MCTYHIGVQQKLRRDCAYAQSRQSLCCSQTCSRDLVEASDQVRNCAYTFEEPEGPFFIGWLIQGLLRLISLRKHYSNILKILPPKTEKFQIKILVFFHISAENIDCGYSLEPPLRGSSNEYPQSMFSAEIRKIMYTPVNPSFTI